MKIRCHTNLDLYPCERWPEELPCRPMVGDIITSSTGLELEVCRIIFKEVPDVNEGRYSDQGKQVIIYTELNLPKHRFENISEFEEWYRTRDKRVW